VCACVRAFVCGYARACVRACELVNPHLKDFAFSIHEHVTLLAAVVLQVHGIVQRKHAPALAPAAAAPIATAPVAAAPVATADQASPTAAAAAAATAALVG